MSLRKMLGRLVLFTVLEMGALAGMPITPDAIENVLRVMNQTSIVETQRTDEE